MQEILKAIPFNIPTGENVHLDFSKMAVPYYVKEGFKVSIFYVDDTFPVDASCSIFSPQEIVTIVIMIKGKFEDALGTWLKRDDVSVFNSCCRRRELYCHEASHLIAIIRAFPSNRYSKVRQDFLEKIRRKFEASIHAEQSFMAIGLISGERPGDSPSVFDKDHFRYEGDNLNYFRLYAELMLDYDTLRNALKNICAANKPYITLDEIAEQTFVPSQFFTIFPEKITEIRKILEEGFD
jgi:hypothetical protein